ncbi:MAG: 5-methyltetrahydropteroyltriglutamate--homocysteine S-methyltransferase [Rhodospirillaceae bacterium]|nr:5-methyltetrahydropteroyltriglutamate--homocysteine S-methyltransferase [Rhodospirillaceae bacterium]|tara:strand:- start:23225 stop:24367 length:1143 start_codon:yes stop_codon:yes gene_type:complete
MTAPVNPPFRAEHIGSLLRPASLLAIRADHAAGKISDEDVRRAEDEAITQAINLQLELGLSSITDGEYRRHAYSDSFTVDVFTGVKIGSTEDRNWTYSDAAGKKTEGRVPIVVDKLEWPGPVNVDDFEFVNSLSGEGVPKVTLPGPCYIHFRSGRDNISTDVYPDLDAFWQDLIDAYTKEIEALYAAGCRYIQLDETSIAKLGDPKIREGLERRGDRWDDLLEIYTDVINEIVRRAPKDLSLGMHLCRGNKGGSWQAAAGYDDVASKLFGKLEVQFYFLEYDSPRAGGFEPLREVPDNKTVILGLVSTKASTLEQADMLKHRIEAAAEYIDMDRLGISPQCGFASLDSGNPISFDDQAAKIKLVVSLARQIWGYTPATAS